MFEEVLEPVLELHAGNKDETVNHAEIEKWLLHRCRI